MISHLFYSIYPVLVFTHVILPYLQSVKFETFSIKTGKFLNKKLFPTISF